MIKLLKLFELDFPTSAEEEPSSFKGEKEAIQDYVDAVRLNEPEGTTIDKATEELKDAPHSVQLKALMALAKNGLLVIKSKGGEEYNDEDTIDEIPPIKLKAEDVLKMFNVQSDVALDALVNYNLNEDNPCWDGYKVGNPKTKISSKTGERVNNCVPVEEAFFIGEDDTEEYDVENANDTEEFVKFMREYQQQLNEADCDCLLEAEYQGRTVPLGKPMRGDSKKFKVYVKNPKTGKVVKVNFGAKGMNIKKNNPVRRKAFRARHNCANPGPRTKARYWSCRKW